jgi:hypothetical protein
MENNFELPQNKPLINGKYKTKEAIKNALYNLFEKEKIEGRYSDDNWSGIEKLATTLKNNGIDYTMLGSEYQGHGAIPDSNLPNRKVYMFELNVRDKEGKFVPLQLKVTGAFVGRTGTMADKEYEITYYFF